MGIRQSLDQKQIAERLACWWFRFHGYLLVAHRWRSPFGKIDLVMRRRKTLVFIEVKWRRHAFFGKAFYVFKPKLPVQHHHIPPGDAFLADLVSPFPQCVTRPGNWP